MGEFSEEAERCGCYAAPDEGLHSGYSFPLLEARKLNAAFVRAHYALLARHPRHWSSISFSNHDVMRTVSRFGGKAPPDGLAKLMLALLLSLKGTALIYQGEELGLPQAPVTRAQLRDPVGDLYYPYTHGRDGCRTPMPWDADAANLGFTSGTPWLPLADAHRGLAVSRQAGDPESTLAFARQFLTARKASAALRLGAIDFRDAPEPVLAFTRTHEGERILCLFNMSGEETAFQTEQGIPLGIGCGDVRTAKTGIALGPYAAAFIRF
jgi:alpha-glucosidase